MSEMVEVRVVVVVVVVVEVAGVNTTEVTKESPPEFRALP